MADRNNNIGGSSSDRSNQDINPDRDRKQGGMGDQSEQGGSGYSGGSRDVGTGSDRSSSDISGDEQNSEGGMSGSGSSGSEQGEGSSRGLGNSQDRTGSSHDDINRSNR